MPDLSRDSVFVKSFKIFRNGDAEIITLLTAEELACLKNLVKMRLVKLRSLNPNCHTKNEKITIQPFFIK